MLQTRLYTAVKAKQCATACVFSTGQECIQIIPAPFPPTTPPSPPAAPTPPLLPRTASGFASYAPSPPPLAPVISPRSTTSALPTNTAPAASSRLPSSGKASAYALTFGSKTAFAPVPDSGPAPGQGTVSRNISNVEQQRSVPAPTHDVSPMMPMQDQNGDNPISSSRFLDIQFLSMSVCVVASLMASIPLYLPAGQPYAE